MNLVSFHAIWLAFDILGCGIQVWTPTGAFPIECNERNAMSKRPLSVNEACTQSLELVPLFFLSTREKE